MHQYSGGLLWNLLHDGCVTEVIGQVPGTLTVAVKIEYLRELFEPSGDRFRVHLQNCTLFEFKPYEGWQKDDPDLEILSCEVDGEACRVWCIGGVLTMCYTGSDVTLEDGTPIPIEALESATQRYWQAFSEGKYIDGRER